MLSQDRRSALKFLCGRRATTREEKLEQKVLVITWQTQVPVGQKLVATSCALLAKLRDRVARRVTLLGHCVPQNLKYYWIAPGKPQVSKHNAIDERAFLRDSECRSTVTSLLNLFAECFQGICVVFHRSRREHTGLPIGDRNACSIGQRKTNHLNAFLSFLRARP